MCLEIVQVSSVFYLNNSYIYSILWLGLRQSLVIIIETLSTLSLGIIIDGLVRSVLHYRTNE